MSARFHVDPATGASGKCFAEKGGCPYRGDTPDANHYDTKAKAERAGEAIMTKLHGSFATKSSLPKTVRNFDSRDKLVEDMKNDIQAKLDTLDLPEGVTFEVREERQHREIFVEVRGFGRRQDIYDYDYTTLPVEDQGPTEKPHIKEMLNEVRKIYYSYNTFDEKTGTTNFNGYVDILNSYDLAYRNRRDSRKHFEKIADTLLATHKNFEEITKDPEYQESLKEFAEASEKLRYEEVVDRGEGEYIDAKKQPAWAHIDNVAKSKSKGLAGRVIKSFSDPQWLKKNIDNKSIKIALFSREF